MCIFPCDIFFCQSNILWSKVLQGFNVPVLMFRTPAFFDIGNTIRNCLCVGYVGNDQNIIKYLSVFHTPYFFNTVLDFILKRFKNIGKKIILCDNSIFPVAFSFIGRGNICA